MGTFVELELVVEPEDIEATYRFFEELKIDFFGDQIATPYAGTGMREDYLSEGLVTNPDDYRFYNGFWANVRTKHLSADEIQFLRWKLRRKYSDRAPIPPTLRASLSMYAILRTMLYGPARGAWRRLKRWNMTEREVYRQEMSRARKQNEFFPD